MTCIFHLIYSVGYLVALGSTGLVLKRYPQGAASSSSYRIVLLLPGKILKPRVAYGRGPIRGRGCG